MNTAYAGIDYSLGRSNIDMKTGIRYGVISFHSVNADALDDIEPQYGEPTCGECGNPAIDASAIEDDTEDWETPKYGCTDYGCAQCRRLFDAADAYPEEPIGMAYDKDGYTIEQCLDTDLFILASPYYTFAQFCSPCVPGAGNLDNPCENGPKTYCLGPDWFEDGIAPYPVYRVDDDTIVA